MWDLAVREEDYARADSLLRRKFTADKRPLEHRAMLALVQRDSGALARLLDEVRNKSSGYPSAPASIALYLNDFRAADEFATAALASPRPQAIRDSLHQLLAVLALAQGSWTAAKREFAQVERVMPSARRQHALSATRPFLPVPRADIALLRDELEKWDPSADPREPNPGLASALHPHLRLYLLGVLSSRLGEDALALQHADELQRIDRPPEAATLVRDLALTVRAEVSARRGRPAEALKLLEPIKGEVPPELLAVPFYSEEGSRYLRAELLYQLGRDEEALQWFANGFQGSPHELVYMAPAHLRQAEIYERLGDTKRAVEHYSRFIHLWQNCDPELRPRVQEARARLTGLVGEPR